MGKFKSHPPPAADGGKGLKIDEYRRTGRRAKVGTIPSNERDLFDRMKKAKRKPDARAVGQDSMRGEHVVGSQRTWVGDKRPFEELDNTSQKILEVPPQSGVSIFDPVLCELLYRWFCPPGGLVLDPFAGGSVRGIVASRLGRQYVGVDLRPEQVAANRQQADAICKDPMPEWVEGDSSQLPALCPDVAADFVFTCPPYADLEVYSDDPRDLSTMGYDDFLAAYRRIIAAAAGMLKPNRFAAFVVGDVRDRKGFYRAFPWETVRAFTDAGLRLYNDAVLITAIGSLPLRAGKPFASSRKLGKTHQNVLIFVKGNPRQATIAVGPVEIAEEESPHG